MTRNIALRHAGFWVAVSLIYVPLFRHIMDIVTAFVTALVKPADPMWAVAIATVLILIGIAVYLGSILVSLFGERK